MPDLPPQHPQDPESPGDPARPERPEGQVPRTDPPAEQVPRMDPPEGQSPRTDAPTEPLPPAAAGAAGPGGAPRRLTRSADDRVLAGVSGGLGQYFSLDPIIFRLLFVLLTAAGGVGLIVYLAGWVLMPVAGRPVTPRGRAWTLFLAVVLLVMSAALLSEPFFAFGSPIIVLALLAGFGYLLWRAAGGDASDRPLVAAGIGLLVFAAAAVGATLVGVAAAALGAGALLAGALVVCGIALVVGAFYGGARWLVLPAIVVAIPLAIVAAADLDIDGPAGEFSYRAATVEEVRGGFNLGMGDMRVDLTGVDFPAGTTRVPIEVGVGNASILVPEDVCVASELDFGIGHADLLGHEIAGVDLVESASASTAASPRSPVLVIAADVGFGNVEVLSAREGYVDLPREDRRRFADRDESWGWGAHPQLTCDEEEL